MKTLTKFVLMILLVASFTIETVGQEHGIYHVKFEFFHSRRIPNNHVWVDFQRYGDSISVHVVSEPMNNQDEKWAKTRLEYPMKYGLLTMTQKKEN